MSMRDWMNNNSSVVTLITVVVLLVALAVIIMNMTGRTQKAKDMYYFDVGTGKVFIDEPGKIPPFEAPSGPDNGVRAYVYSCGECSNFDGMTVEELKETGAFVGSLQKYTDEARKWMPDILAGNLPEGLSWPDTEMVQRDMLVKDPESDQWRRINSPAGTNLMTGYLKRCGADARPQPCQP